MFIIGARYKRIKRFHDREIECPNCGGYMREFAVYRQYFHIFFIPVFPVGVKKITSSCCSCGHGSDRKKDFYLKQARTPLYLYTGLLAIICFSIFMVFENQKNQKFKQEYIANPLVGDVYLVRQKTNMKGYYFMKVKEIKEDTLFLVFNRYIYSDYVSSFDDEDYFVLDNTGFTLKEDLQELLDDNIINSVKRDYSLSSRFHIEKKSGEVPAGL